MEVRATAKYVRVQPRKVRIIADEVRGKYAGHAAALLRHHTSKSARSLRKVLISAMANAAENHGLAPETLKIATIMVDEGPKLKRMTAKAMGRGARIEKKTSHITVVVEDAEVPTAVRPHGAKAKARPTFAAPKKGRGGNKSDAGTGGTVPPPVEEPTPSPAPTPVEEPATDVTPEEATPVSASEAPEEAGATSPAVEQEETTPQAEGAAEANEENK